MNNDENQYWLLGLFGTLGIGESKTGMNLSWKSMHGLRNTYRNHCGHNSPCHPQMKVKALTYKEKAI